VTSEANLDIDPRRVFLVSGQFRQQKVGGRGGVAPDITQRVVFAEDSAEAYRRLADALPSFQPVGLASLFDYEDAARRLRAVVAGQSQEWDTICAAQA
jgi:hypothetical protein